MAHKQFRPIIGKTATRILGGAAAAAPFALAAPFTGGATLAPALGIMGGAIRGQPVTGRGVLRGAAAGTMGGLTGFLTGGPMGGLLGAAGGGLTAGASPLNIRSMLTAGGTGLAAGGLTQLLAPSVGAAFPGLGITPSMYQGPFGAMPFFGGAGQQMAGRVGAAGGGFSGLFRGLTGGIGQMLGGMGMPGFGGAGTGAGTGAGGGAGGGFWGNLPALVGGILGERAQTRELERGREIEDIQRSMLGQAQQVAGISPEARRETLRRAQQQLRAAQAERGIFESGVSAAQEAELMPMIEQQINEAQVRQILAISGGYDPMVAESARRAALYQGTPFGMMFG